MKRHGRLDIKRNAARIEPPSQPQRLDVFFFEVEIEGDEIKGVQQVEGWPFESTNDNSSLAAFHQWGVAFQVLWKPDKPDPASELRYKGYLAILDEIGSRDPELAKLFDNSAFGFGHPEKAQLEWHKPEGNDA